MTPLTIAFLSAVLLIISAGLVIDRVVRPGLTQFLNELIRIPAGVEVYKRVFIVVVMLSVLGVALDPSFNLQASARFMEFVWAVGANLHKVFDTLTVVLLVYLALLTVLSAALRPRQ
jgi:hypothetical protein